MPRRLRRGEPLLGAGEALVWRRMPALAVSLVPVLGVAVLLGRGVLLIVLLHHRLVRLVLIVLAVQHCLLLRRRVALPRVLALIRGDRGGARRGSVRRVLPTRVLRFPALAPVLAPPRRRVGDPSVVEARRMAVVPDEDAQDEVREDVGIYYGPRPVVPGAGVQPVD